MGSHDCIGFDHHRVFGQRDHPSSGCNDDHDDSIITDSHTPPMPCKVPFPVPTYSSPCGSSTPPARFVHHTVSEYDTLAGVAIKYGVEVADIKRMNSLVTDRQMFALTTLHIPLPGRHPPSPYLSDSPGPRTMPEWTPPCRRSDVLDTFYSLRLTPQRQVSSAMCPLQGCHGRNSAYNRTSYDHSGRCLQYGPHMMDDCDPTHDVPPPINHPLPHAWVSKPPRQRRKEDADFTWRNHEQLLNFKEETGTGGWFSAIAGKGLALRRTAANRINLGCSEADGAGHNACPSGPGDPTGVRKSYSTSSLQVQECSSSLSIFSASKWSLKPDLQALSTLAIARPILDGLSKPITGWKTKPALD